MHLQPVHNVEANQDPLKAKPYGGTVAEWLAVNNLDQVSFEYDDDTEYVRLQPAALRAGLRVIPIPAESSQSLGQPVRAAVKKPAPSCVLVSKGTVVRPWRVRPVPSSSCAAPKPSTRTPAGVRPTVAKSSRDAQLMGSRFTGRVRRIRRHRRRDELVSASHVVSAPPAVQGAVRGSEVAADDDEK